MEMNHGIEMFGKESSLKLKGVAIIMMLMHHLFRTVDRFEGYSVRLYPLKEQQLINMAETCKICVSVFAFITGYGLFLNYQNHQGSAQSWVAQRYIKTLSGYWFVWIICSILSQYKDGRVAHLLFSEGTIRGGWNSLLSFLGVNNIFGTPSIDYRWWYMSAAVLFIFITPLIYQHKNNLWMVLIAPVLFIRVIFVRFDDPVTLGGQSSYAFITPFIIGTLFARYNLANRWISIGLERPLIKTYKCITEIWVIIFFYKIYRNLPSSQFWEFNFGVFPLAVIMFLIEFILPIKCIDKILMVSDE